MIPTRRTLSLSIALLLTAASASALYYLLFVEPKITLAAIVAAGIFFFTGLSWFWSDFTNADPGPET
jgi:hypothetical protein